MDLALKFCFFVDIVYKWFSQVKQMEMAMGKRRERLVATLDDRSTCF